MKKILHFIFISFLILNLSSATVSAQEERQSISNLPFEGYFLAPEESGIAGLLFENNQLLIYLAEEDIIELDDLKHDFIHFLEDFHAFPHPDLKNYNEDVRNLYIEESDLPYDLKEVYEEITGMITPDMSQLDIQNLINNRVPGIYYTQKNGYRYYIIASPTVRQLQDSWNITLFDETLFEFTVDEADGVITDQDGVIYEYVAGITPG